MLQRLQQRLLGSWVGRYVLLSGISLCLNLMLTIGLHELLRVPEEAAFMIALLTVFCTNFVGLRYYVYPDSQLSFGQQLGGYVTSSVGFRALEYIAFLLAHSWLGCPYRVTVVAVLIVSYAAKQLVHRHLVFHAKTSTDS